jgi:hypothetical protein
MLVPRAQLKVFSPLDAFPVDERARIQAVLDRGGGLSRSQATALEEARITGGLLRGWPRPTRDTVQLRRVGNGVMVCPLDLEVRAQVALSELGAVVPDVVLDALLPHPVCRAVAERVPTGVPYVRDHPFLAPLTWFVAFSPREQRVTDPPEGTGPRLVHLTLVGQAAGRLERVFDVIERTLGDADDLLAEVAELGVWLDAFPAEALLELDHGTAGRLRGVAALKRDRTCAQLWRAVEALERGDDHEAAVAYATARASWSRSRALAHAS